MRTLCVEPSCFVFASGGDSGADAAVDFNDRFWPEFESVRTFWSVNESSSAPLSLRWSETLQDAVTSMFPFDLAAARALGSNGFEAHSQVLRFVANKALLVPYGGGGDRVMEVLSRRGIYRDEDVLLAWSDLIEQASGAGCVEVVASAPQASCLDDGRRDLTSGCTVECFRIRDRRWPRGFLDPVALTEMSTRRNVERSLDEVYEDSGHQPPRSIKKVIGRTAADALVRRVATRVSTTWYQPDLAESCTVTATANPAEVRFRVSDGSCTYKGIFSTVAQDPVEAALALEIIRRCFLALCSEERFVVER